MAAGLRAGQAFAEAYTRAKRAAGVADFNDLIDWTRQLLMTPGMGDWVRYKLDREVDHVLVDEAQDTNAAQWEIIGQLVAEYFSGSSESDERHRTLFMVGDLKQAIYGFQGTDPKRFEQARDEFRERADDLRDSEDTLDLFKRRTREFRDLVDRRELPLRAGRAGCRRRRDRRAGTPGACSCRSGAKPRRHFTRSVPARSNYGRRSRPNSKTRAMKARNHGLRCGRGSTPRRLPSGFGISSSRLRYLPSMKRSLTAGDILILVRSRGELASLIVARLFAAGVPVAGVDRLHLHEPLAVQDLLAAVKFAVQPNDDLTLGCLLVSPLVGWDQEQLRALAFGRKGSLWREIAPASGGERRLSLRARSAGRVAEDRGFHDSVDVSRDDPVGADRGAAQALRRGSAWRRAIRSTS